MENLTDVVDRSLYSPDPLEESIGLISIGSGAGDSWHPGPEDASRSWDTVVCWFSDPNMTSES
jgi:hypothetical protein